MTTYDIPPKTVADADAEIAEIERQLRETEQVLQEKVQNLDSLGASEDIVDEAREIARPGNEKSVEERLVDETRAVYIQEYLKCKKENKKKLLIAKTKHAISNFFVDKDDQEKFNEERYFSKEYTDAKEIYNRARVEMGNAMFQERKAELEHAGLSGEELEHALTEYKAVEILGKTIIEERQKLIDAQVEGNPINPVLWKKLVQGYLNIKPRWKRVAISTLLFLPAAAAGAAGASIVAGYGLAGLATVKFAKSMFLGTISSHAVKGIDLLNKNKDKKFAEEQEQKHTALKNQFALGEISLEKLEAFESGTDSIEEEKKRRERNRVLLKAGVSIAIGGAVGAFTYHELNALADHHPDIPTVIPHTQAPAAIDTVPALPDHTPVAPIEQHIAPKIHHDPIIEKDPNAPGTEPTLKSITPQKGEYNIPHKDNIAPQHGNFGTAGDEKINPPSGNFETGNPAQTPEQDTTPIHQSAPAGTIENQTAPKGVIENNIKTTSPDQTLNKGQAIPTGAVENDMSKVTPIELQKPIDLGSATKLSQPPVPNTLNESLNQGKVIPTGAAENTPKVTTPEDLVKNQTTPTGAIEKPAAYTTDPTLTQGKAIPTGDIETPKTTEVIAGQTTPLGTVEHPTGQQLDPTLNKGQSIPTGAAENTPKVTTPEDLVKNQTTPLGTVEQPQPATLPKVEAAPIAEPSRYTAGVRNINPTRGMFNAGDRDMSTVQPSSNIEGSGNGFTREVPMTDREEIETVYANQNEYAIRASALERNAVPGVRMETIEQDPRHFETASDVRKAIGRHNVVIEKPEGKTINDIEYKNWNRAADATLKANNVKVTTYADYQKEKELQTLFGHGTQVVKYVPSIDKNASVVQMDYFRTIPEWNIVQKIPARYFFDFTDAKEASDSTLIDIPKADIDKLLSAGILKDQIVEINGVETHSYVFAHRDELLRLEETYKQILSDKDIALGNHLPLVTDKGDETIESYVRRVTRRVYQTDDGTYFAPKKELIITTPTQEQIYTGRTLQNTRAASDGTIYPQSGGYYSPNTRLASRAASIFSGRMSTPVRLSF